MKTIEKKSLDRVIALTRAIGDCDLSCVDLLATDRILEAKHLTRNVEVDWLRVLDLVDFILGFQGFKPDADNEVVYQVLNMLGWDVV